MLTQAPCKRCGKMVVTAVRSLLGLDGLKVQWGVICQACVTPDEQYQLLREMGDQLKEACEHGLHRDTRNGAYKTC